MNSKKSLEELGREYASYIKMNEENIRACRKKLKYATDNGDNTTADELRKTLSVLYEISRDLKATSEKLIKYYRVKDSACILCNAERRE